MRTVEDVFVTLAHITGLGHGRDALRVLRSAISNAGVDEALAVWRRVRKVGQSRTWRVISQKSGSHDFRRLDAGEALSDALRRTLPRCMHHVADDAELEFWLWLSGSEALIGLRLSDATMRHRTYKREHIPASLRPTVAAAMAWLACPTAEDIVLDPLCGAGTILIERALLGPLKQAIGGDIREEAVAISRRNARFAGAKATWHVWDAQSLPLNTASVTRIIANLPFGKQIGTREINTDLYKKLLNEFGRVLTKDGVLVTLTSDDRVWDSMLRNAGWPIVKKVVLVVLGQPASIFVAERA
jgi:tRNA (guanine6-N2)-methyltransferase